MASEEPHGNLAELLWARCQEDPGREFLITPEDGRSWSYSDVCRSATAFGRRLPEQRTIACMLPNGAHLLVVAFGTWAAGNRVALVNPALSSEERDRALEDAGAAILVTDKEMALRLGHPRGLDVILADEAPELCAPLKDGALGQVAPVGERADAAVIFTSGTTGRAKAAVLTHDGLQQGASSLARSLRGRPGPYSLPDLDTPPTLIAGPIAQTGGVNAIVFALLVGRRLLIVHRFRVELVAELAERYRLDTFIGTPAMLQMLATHPGPINWTTLRTVISGGAPLTAAVKSRFERRFQTPIVQVYGQTETGYIAGYSREDIREGRVRDGAVGRVYEGVDVLINDPDGNAQPPMEVGEIIVRTPHSMRGYARSGAPSPTTVDDSGGWIATGDLGYLDPDRHLYLVGRKDDMLICGGFNIYPAEVEQALLSHDAVIEAAVFAIPDERLGEAPVAAVVRGVDRVTEQELIAFCRDRLAHFKAPRQIRFFPELPKTESNKILRRELKANWLAQAR